MKQALLLIALLVAGVAATAQNNDDKMQLNNEQQCMVAIACLEAKGDLEQLATAIDSGLDAGLTVSQVKEALSQLYAYTGFPRSLNALGTLQRVLAQREAAGKTSLPGREASPMSEDYDALREGTEVQTRLSGRPFDYAFAPATDYYLKAHLFGDIFARDNLTHAERELVTVSALSGLEAVEPQLVAHVRGALNMGLKEEEVKSIPAVLRARVGEKEAWRASRAIAIAFDQPDGEGRPVDFAVWPKGEPNTAYAQYFIGNSYLAPLDTQNGGPVNVTFEPRCRNNWHIHHKAVQVLVCVAGRGWYQEEGKEAVEMRPGSVIAIPAEAKHWHGAARDSWFQHLTYMTAVQEGSTTEWLEPVNDEHYDQLP